MRIFCRSVVQRFESIDTHVPDNLVIPPTPTGRIYCGQWFQVPTVPECIVVQHVTRLEHDEYPSGLYQIPAAIWPAGYYEIEVPSFTEDQVTVRGKYKQSETRGYADLEALYAYVCAFIYTGKAPIYNNGCNVRIAGELVVNYAMSPDL